MAHHSLLRCPRCGFERTLGDTYTQADLMCPSEDHEETELVLVGQIEVVDAPPENGDEQPL